MEATRTRTGTLTPFGGDPILVTLDIDPTDNLPTRASLAPHLNHDAWHLEVPWDADDDDGTTHLTILDDVGGRYLARLDLDPAPATPVGATPARWITTRRRYANGIEYALDHMDGFEPHAYQPGVLAGHASALAREDWEHYWTVGDEVYDTEASALAAASETGEYVIRITLDDARDALQRRFGPEEE